MRYSFGDRHSSGYRFVAVHRDPELPEDQAAYHARPEAVWLDFGRNSEWPGWQRRGYGPVL